MSRSITISVVGLPAPQGSKRHVGNGIVIESSKRVAPWRESVKSAAVEAMGGIALRLDGPLYLLVTFYMPRPKKPKAHMPDRAPDLSKLIRSTEDALTEAGVWADDARVVRVEAEKRYCEPNQHTGAIIVVKEE